MAWSRRSRLPNTWAIRLLREGEHLWHLQRFHMLICTVRLFYHLKKVRFCFSVISSLLKLNCRQDLLPFAWLNFGVRVKITPMLFCLIYPLQVKGLWFGPSGFVRPKYS